MPSCHSLVMLILITWSWCCPMSPLYIWLLFFIIITYYFSLNKQSVDRHFMTMYSVLHQKSLTLLPGLVSIHDSKLKQLTLWWFSNSSIPFTLTVSSWHSTICESLLLPFIILNLFIIKKEHRFFLNQSFIIHYSP